ncbi:MAG: molybdenum cofactor guanylyltransferase [Bacteroidia bacterium]|nr:molybdenum cofactor guanylyltransferase [Bacteroidia bacterium]
MNLTGIILAGGESSRIGKDKSKIIYNNLPLIEYPINLFRKYCDEIIISADSNKLNEYNYLKVPDEIGKYGPLAGIYSCLKKSSNHVNIVISCDMPLITDKLISYIIDNSNGFDLIMPFYNSHYEPLCAIYTKSLIPVIEDLFSKNDYSPLSLIPVCNFKQLEISESLPFFNKNVFSNVNTIYDLNNLK